MTQFSLQVADIFPSQLKRSEKIVGLLGFHGITFLVRFLMPFPTTHTHTYMYSGCPRGVMVKAMDCGIVVREFVLQSPY